jgi:urea transport system ATP-binding protein
MLTVEGIDLYYGESHCLRDVSITTDLGKITCLLGRNGVGKSSLLRSIVGLEKIRSGKIVLDGQDISALPPYQRARRGIAYVPQGRDIFPLLTVEENLKTGFSPLARSARKIADEIYELFPVLKSMLHRRGGDLSGGQQQQLAIARALITKPKLLLLDEPTEGIQPSIIKDIERIIRLLGKRGDMAILLVEQYYDFARSLADNMVIMNRGEVVLAGVAGSLPEDEVHRHLTV